LPGTGRELRNLAVGCAGLVVVAVLCLAWLLPHAPPMFDNVWGFAPEGAAFVNPSSPLERPVAWHSDSFVAALRATLVVAWASWVLFLLIASRIEARVSLRIARLVVLAAAVLVAICFPPMLSRDVLGYVAYGRIAGLYLVNPYLHGRQLLEDVGDPAAAFLVWDTPLPYGPFWVLLAGVLAKLGEGAIGLWLEVFLRKALAAQEHL